MYREVLGLMAAKFLTDAAWFFFVFWLPKYLGDVRDLDIKKIGYFAWIPYACGGVGSLIGGGLSSYLIRHNFSVDRARKIALAISAALMPASLFIAGSPLSFAIVFYSVAMFGHQFWSSNVQTVPADLFPSRIVGSVEGLLGSAGSFGAMLFMNLTGSLVEKHGYAPVFVMAGLFHPLALLIILVTVKRIKPLQALAN
jgi:ACS family hexuronate transporter-like MFS transporter